MPAQYRSRSSDVVPPAAPPGRKGAPANTPCLQPRMDQSRRGGGDAHDEAKVRHACLTPIWSRAAWFADYVLPMATPPAPRPHVAGDARTMDRLLRARGCCPRGPASSVDGGRTEARASARCGGGYSGSSCRGASIPTQPRIRSTSSRPIAPASSESRSCTGGSSSTPCPACRGGAEGGARAALMRKYGCFLIGDGMQRRTTSRWR